MVQEQQKTHNIKLTSEVYAATRSQDLLNELSPSEFRQVCNTLIWPSKLYKYYLKSYKARIRNEQFRWGQFHSRGSDDAQQPLDEQHADSQEARHATALGQNCTQIQKHLLLQRIYNKKNHDLVI